ncbi:VOC family protein [Phyllobacterium sp. LjRoot231]|uniref:VOC family protein n=1 Tax=Phyllobacterium sp. LjRoot231 TaxID=3342289 RepID=UPI003ECEA0CB
MLNPDFMLIYVDDPQRSRAFYAGLLGREPVEESPTFALFVMESGLKLGMWIRQQVEPAAIGAPGSSELVFAVGDLATLEATYNDWLARDIPIVQKPTEMDFGRTFVALDPDGHRLRVFVPAEDAGQ